MASGDFCCSHFSCKREFQTKSHLLGESKNSARVCENYFKWKREWERKMGSKQKELQHLSEHAHTNTQFEIIKRELEQNFKLNMEIFAEFSHVVMFVEILFRKPLLPSFLGCLGNFLDLSLFLILCLCSCPPFPIPWICHTQLNCLLANEQVKSFPRQRRTNVFVRKNTFAWLFYRILFHLEFVSPLYIMRVLCVCVRALLLSFSHFTPHLSYGTFRITTVTKSR